MAVSSRPENFFQTTSSIAENQRKQRKAVNTFGNPIKLPSKILALDVVPVHDSAEDTVLVAEAGGTVSVVNLSSGQISRIGRGAQAPLTCLTHLAASFSTHGLTRLDVFAGGWDKTITKFSLVSKAVAGYEDNSATADVPTAPKVTSQTNWKAHGDFLKCLSVMYLTDRKPILLSGGADGELNIWGVTTDENDQNTTTTTTTTTNKRLATVKPQARGIESIVLDPYSSPEAPTVFFSTSQREIFSIQLPATTNEISSSVVQSKLSTPLLVHETSVYRLHFDKITGDLWTASADKTAKKLLRDEGWKPDHEMILQHPDFVRDIVTHERLPYVVTACRDEEIRIWNSNSGQLYHVLSGHYEEVTGLAIIYRHTYDNNNSSNNNNNINSNHQKQKVENDTKPSSSSSPLTPVLISISIDATLRTWNLDPKHLAAEINKTKTGDDGGGDGDGVALAGNTSQITSTGISTGTSTSTGTSADADAGKGAGTSSGIDNNDHQLDLGLTEEEEAELRAMMEED